MKAPISCLPILLAACAAFKPAPCVVPDPKFDKLGNVIAEAPPENVCRPKAERYIDRDDESRPVKVHKPKEPDTYEPPKPKEPPKDKPKPEKPKGGSNPGNEKPVGKSGETPNKKDGWGKGNKGKSK